MLRTLYRSIMVISGATRPEAQAAAVTSDVILQGSSRVLRFCGLKKRPGLGSEGRTTFGIWPTAFSVIDPLRPSLRSRSRVIAWTASEVRISFPCHTVNEMDDWVVY